MTPSTALRDPAFLRFVWIVPALFIVAGVILVVVQFIFKKELGSVWLTYRSWWVMGILGLAVVFAGTVPVVIAVALLGVFAFRELARASELRRDAITSWLIAAAIALLALSALTSTPDDIRQITMVMTVALLFLISTFRKRAGDALPRPDVALLGFVLLGLFFTQIAFLTKLPHAYGFICYIIFATELSDVAAFICGRSFGRHLLAPKVSPRKTWEGAIGALIVSIALPWAFRFALPGFGTMQLLTAGLIVGIGGQLGDLTISLVKRALGAKDMGTAIPGHGGILDRIDSLIYVAPLFMQLAAHCEATT